MIKETSMVATPPPSTPPPTKARELAPFLRQLREILRCESPTTIRWTADGRAFEILDLHQMTHVVLPKYFKHRKYASFQRQLNYFSFRKWTRSRATTCTFSNPSFLRDAPELTWRIVRKREVAGPRRRAQSFEPAPTTEARSTTETLVAADAIHAVRGAAISTATTATTATTVAASPHRVRARAHSVDVRSSESACPSVATGVAECEELLRWIDAQFPSVASLARLEEPTATRSHASYQVDIVWTPYQPTRESVQPRSVL